MKLKNVIVIGTVVILFGVAIFTRNMIINDLKDNGKVITVKIIERLLPAKGGVSPSFRCEFTYNEQVKVLISPSSITHNKKSYVGSYFPAIYSPKSDAIRILMKSEDFEEFGIPYPDSLLYKVNDFKQ